MLLVFLSLLSLSLSSKLFFPMKCFIGKFSLILGPNSCPVLTVVCCLGRLTVFADAAILTFSPEGEVAMTLEWVIGLHALFVSNELLVECRSMLS